MTERQKKHEEYERRRASDREEKMLKAEAQSNSEPQTSVSVQFSAHAEGPAEPSNETNKRSRPPVTRWRIATKLTFASILTILLTMVAGGVGLWQVSIIDQATRDARKKEQQRSWSLELLAAGHRLVAALDRMVLTEDPLLASTEIATSLGTLDFYLETLQESGGVAGVEEMQTAHEELHQSVSEIDLLARQELWTEAGAVLEQQVYPVNERMGVAIRRLVRQANQDVEAMTSHAQSVVQQAILRLALLLVLTTAIALGWRRFVFRDMSLSITQLRQGVMRISSGDLEHKLEVRTGDEIEELGDEFNRMAGELADLIGSLEQRVAERTRGLRAAAEVSRATTSVLDLDELLRQVVNLVQERFNLYYVGLFLLDDERRFAVLQAGTGEAGRAMLTQGHRLEIGGESMIGQCVANSEARIALDVGAEAVRFDNPFLPNTRSELALPLRSRGRITGAMTVQSTEEAAFDQAYIAILQTMADQVAVAIDNARLFADTQAALEQAEATHRRYLGQAWTEYLQTSVATSYETERQGTPPLGDTVLSQVQQAIEQRATVLTGTPRFVLDADVDGEDAYKTEHSTLVTPITLRGGETIGALGLRDDEGMRQWTEDEIALAEAVAERMALTAERLRLLDTTQRRAAQEQLVSEITARMRESLDVDTVLQTAAREIGEALGIAEVQVRLGGGGVADEL